MTMTADLRTQAADLLDRAAQHIERYGWAQDCWYVREPDRLPWESPACASGAVYLAAGIDPYRFGPHGGREDPTVLARSILAEYLDSTSVALWNDDWATTKNKVVTSLREAARQARQP
jgi:hypothetical protein